MSTGPGQQQARVPRRDRRPAEHSVRAVVRPGQPLRRGPGVDRDRDAGGQRHSVRVPGRTRPAVRLGPPGDHQPQRPQLDRTAIGQLVGASC